MRDKEFVLNYYKDGFVKRYEIDDMYEHKVYYGFYEYFGAEISDTFGTEIEVWSHIRKKVEIINFAQKR